MPTATVPPTPAASPTPEGPFELLAPDPLVLEPVLDAAAAVSATIPVEGGSLTATAADGSVFTLTVPPEALLSDQLITMTPLAGVEGEAIGDGYVAGVDLAPDGLLLFDAATLTIEPAQPIAPERELSLAVQGQAHEAFLYPLLPEAEAATFAITHFSAYFLAAGDAAVREAVAVRVPGSAAAQFLQMLQALMAGQRTAHLLVEEGNPEFAEQAAALARSYWLKALRPRIEQAEASGDWRFVCQVIAEVTGFARTLELLGITDLGVDFEVDDILNRLLARQAGLVLDEAADLCQAGSRLLAWMHMLRVARTEALRGADFGLDLAGWRAQCAPPSLLFSSRATRTAYWPYAGDVSRLVTDIQVEAEVPLRYDDGQRAFVGEGPLELTVLDANSMHAIGGDAGTHFCDLAWQPIGSTATVDKLTVNLNQIACEAGEAAPGQDEPAEIELTLDLGTPSENWMQDCSAVNARGGIQLSNEDGLEFHRAWIDMFRLLHRENLADDSLYYVEGQGWEFSGPSQMLFTEWRYSGAKSYAYAVIEPFESEPICELCFQVDVVEETRMEVR